MKTLEINVREQFIELGNRFFNIKEVEWNNSNELCYESSTTDPFNKYFIEGEERIDEVYKSIISFLYQVLELLSFKRRGDGNKTTTTKNNLNKNVSKPSYTSYPSSYHSNNSAQYNLSKYLLQRLNNELKSSDSNKNVTKSSRKNNKFKNQLIMPDNERDSTNINVLNYSLMSNKIKNGISKTSSIFHFLKQ